MEFILKSKSKYLLSGKNALVVQKDNMKKPKNYWDYLTMDGKTYQMGAQSHRVYLLDLLASKGVESILDNGCGTGPIYQLIRDTKIEGDSSGGKRWNFKYKGTDYSQGMIEVCQKEFPEADWQVEDARKLTEYDNSWDCVLLMHCLDHLDDYQAAIKEAARVAKKYVLIVLWRGVNYDPNAVNNLNNRSRYGRADDEPDWEDTHLQDFAWIPLCEAFVDAGLTVIQKEDGPEVNKEGRFNTLILLEKK
jgi:SAM-dependent methyltransferase